MRDCHVFLAPHSDDETIGMAGAIARAVASGAHVVLVLVTDNLPSERARSFFAEHNGSLAVARRAEFWAAAQALGVTDVRVFGIPEELMFTKRSLAESQLADAMRWLHHELVYSRGGPVTHHVVMGERDAHAETGTGTLAHRICESAGQLFHTAIGATVILHGVYVYSHPIGQRTAPTIEHLTDDEMAAKQRAIAAYKPSETSIGYGYASVPELFDAAESDPREFTEKL